MPGMTFDQFHTEFSRVTGGIIYAVQSAAIAKALRNYAQAQVDDLADDLLQDFIVAMQQDYTDARDELPYSEKQEAEAVAKLKALGISVPVHLMVTAQVPPQGEEVG